MSEITVSKEEIFSLKNEIKMAEKVNETKLLPQAIEALQRYTGRHIPNIARDWDIVLNEIYPIIQYELPVIFFRNPKVFLKPRNKTHIVKKRDPITGEMVETEMDSQKSASTQEAILNYSLSEINYKNEVRKSLMDALMFKHGVLWHGYKGNFGMTDEQSFFVQDEMVFVKRLCPMNFLFDPSVSISNIDEAKWVARSFLVPYTDLMEDETLDVDKKKVQGISGYGLKIEQPEAQGTDKLRGATANFKTLLDYADSDFRAHQLSKFVKVYEILKRPTPKEKRKGEKGKIVLFTFEQDRPLRANSWPYKAEGWPGKVLQFNEIPDSPFGISDLEVYGPIADQKNMVINLQLRNAQENSKNYIAIAKDGAEEEDIEKVRLGDQTIILFDGETVTGKMQVATSGGAASSELYQLDGRIQNNLDEKVGIPDMKKGTLRSGEESATSVQIRNMGSSIRPAYRQDLMADFLKDSCHYLNQLLKQFYPIDKAVRIVGSLDIQWSENPSKEEIQADTDVEIDVISMLPEDPQKEIGELTTVLNLMINALNSPAIMQKLGQEQMTFNISPIIENLLMRLKVRDPDVFRMIKPEESQGFVSVKEMREARTNVEAALAGQQPPSPPQPGQDHMARLETYGSIAEILQEFKDSPAFQIIQQLILAQQALLEEEQSKQATPNKQINLKKPSAITL